MEMMAVLAVIAAVMAIVAGSYRFFSKGVKESSQNLAKTIQGTYFQSIEKAKVYRISFSIKDSEYKVEELDLNTSVPPKDDEEAYRKWEDEQKKKEEELESLSVEERRQLKKLDRADFKTIKTAKLGSGVQIKKILKAGSPDQSYSEKQTPKLRSDEPFLIFYPNGEVDSALIVLDDNSGNIYSLITEPLTGRVRIKKGDWEDKDWARRETKP